MSSGLDGIRRWAATERRRTERMAGARSVEVHTPAEMHVLEAARNLAGAFRTLEHEEGEAHPSHGRDVADAVHVVQRIVAIRLAKRADPDAWR